MINTLTALALSLTPIQTLPPEDDFCLNIERLANVIMTIRHSGTPLAEVLTAIQTNKDQPELRDLTETMVLEAYALPEALTENLQDEQTDEFVDRMFTICKEVEGEVESEQLSTS